MKKARINLHYRYLGPSVGAIPYIHVDYINDFNESRNAMETLYERRVGDNSVEDYHKNSIEKSIKESIVDVVKSLGDGLVISYCNEIAPGSFESNSTSDLSVFDDEKMKDALISGVALKFDTQMMSTLSANDKVRLISMVMVKLFESIRTKKIGFSAEKDLEELSVDFDIDGLSLDLIKNLSNYGEVVYNVAANHVAQFNKKAEMETMVNNQGYKNSEETTIQKLVG